MTCRPVETPASGVYSRGKRYAAIGCEAPAQEMGSAKRSRTRHTRSSTWSSSAPVERRSRSRRPETSPMHPRSPRGDRRRRRDPRRELRFLAAARQAQPPASAPDRERGLRPTASAGARSTVPARRRGHRRAPTPWEQPVYGDDEHVASARFLPEAKTSSRRVSRAGGSTRPRCRRSPSSRTIRSETA